MAEAETLHFELVTPERLAISEQVAMVEVPGELGDFGVLPGHAPFMSMIRPGVVSVHQLDGSVKYYFIPSGYAEVNPEGCVVLTEHVRDLDQADPVKLAEEVEITRSAFEAAEEGPAKERAQRAYELAQLLQLAIDTH